MTVKGIFKVLLGSIVIPSCGFVLVETYNLMAVSNQIQNLEKVAARQACELATQESFVRIKPVSNIEYRNADGYYAVIYNGATDFMCGPKGSLFKNGNSAEWGHVQADGTPYNYLTTWMMDTYVTPYNSGGIASAKTTLHGPAVDTLSDGGIYHFDDLYYSAELLKLGYSHKAAGDLDSYVASTKITDWSDPNIDAKIQQNIDASRAYNYMEKWYTPANVSIPYLQTNLVNSLFHYNLIALFSENNVNNIRNYYYTDTYSDTAYGTKQKVSDPIKTYVSYKGWQIYPYASMIYNTTYDTYDIRTDTGRKALKEVTSINGSVILNNIKTETKVDGTTIDDPYYITVAHTHYVVPVRYEGVTPLKRVIAWLVNEKRVVGLGDNWNVDSGGSKPGITNKVDVDYTDEYYEEVNTDMSSTGGYPSSGELYINLIK